MPPGTSGDSASAGRNGLYSPSGSLCRKTTRPITSFKTAWTKVRENAGVKGRWHDNRRTLVTELAESGAGDEVIMSIAGHVSRAMLSRYSHVRMEAKRRAVAPESLVLQ
jgi:integrase